jgi:hypothetical protein
VCYHYVGFEKENDKKKWRKNDDDDGISEYMMMGKK